METRFARLTRSPLFRWGEHVVTVALLAWVAWRLGPQLSAWTGVADHQDEVPTWSVTTLEGGSIGSKQLRGRVVVLNFWATWCPPCRLEMPSLQRLQDDYGTEDLVVLGVSVDAGGRPAVAGFLSERGISYPVAMADRAVRDAFGHPPGVPTTFLLDRSGRVRHRVVGYFAPPALRAAVDRLLGEPDPEETPIPGARRGVGGTSPGDPGVSDGTGDDP